MSSRRLEAVWKLVLVGCLVLGGVAWAGPDEHLPLSLSIAVPIRGKQRSIESARFQVVLRNISTHNVSLWRE